MSWNPFKKVFSGRVTKNEDVEFEREVNRLKQVEAVSKRMYKDMKKCNEMETGYIRSKQHLVNGIKLSPIGRLEPLKDMAEMFGDIMTSLLTYSKELKINQDTVFVDPIKRLNNVFKQVDLHIKQREQKLQEYERQLVKLDKQGRRYSQSLQQSGNQSKLEQTQRTVAGARADYERVHDRIMLEIPQLLEGRVGYFDICLFAVLKAQALYHHECCMRLSTALETLQGSTDAKASLVRSEETIQKETLAHLSNIKMLSIVGNISTVT